MWSGGYADMPYMAVMPNGDIVSALTVSSAHEGSTSQHVIILRSTDGGSTWAETAEMEPASAPESAWGVLWLDPRTGVLYCFYLYNIDDIRYVPDNDGVGGTTRADCIGAICYRVSTDNGVTWSQRHIADVPQTAIDGRNPFGGAHRLLWICGLPQTHDGAAYIGFSKMGLVDNGNMFVDTEAFILKARPLTLDELDLTEESLDSPHVDFSLLGPIRNGGPVNEENSPVVFPDGLISTVFRTTSGQLAEAWSADGGQTWSVEWARDKDGGIIPQPRAKAAQFLLPDGRVLMWGHNNNSVPWSSSFAGPRNPVFYRIGQRVGYRIRWDEPKLLIWDKVPETTMSYPSFAIYGDELLVSATDKAMAKVFRFPLSGLYKPA